MDQLLDQIPLSYFGTAVVFWVLGVATAWRFARYFERLRDAVEHARHHFERAKDFAHHAGNNVVGFVLSGMAFTVVLGAVGFLAYLRVT